MSGVGGLPASGLAAVTVTVLVQTPGRTGSISVYPGGSRWTGVGSVSFGRGVSVQSTLTARLGTNGTLTVRDNLAVGVHVAADVSGYYLAGTPTVAGTFGAVPLVRLLDTRSGTGGKKAALAPGESRTFQVAGRGGVPASGVAATAVNVAVLTPGRTGSVAVYPGGSAWNGSATVSFVAGVTTQSMTTVALGSSGAVTVRNNTAVAINVAADVAGYFRSGTPAVTGAFGAIRSVRMYDSRLYECPGCQYLRPGQHDTFFVTGNASGALPSSGGLAAALNVTVLGATAAGSLGVYPGTTMDGSSQVSFRAGSTGQSSITTGLGIAGNVTIRNNSSRGVEVVVDATGWYLDQPSPVQWHDGVTAAEGHDGVNSLSCSTQGNCAAVTIGTPYALTYDGTDWSAPTTVPGVGYFGGVSCAGDNFCMAVGRGTATPVNRIAVAYDGKAWSTPVTLPAATNDYMSAVSCSSAHFCGALDHLGHFFGYDGQSWTAGPRLPGVAQYLTLSIACVSSEFCAAHSNAGDVWTYDGTGWSAAVNLGHSADAGSLSCASASFCVATDIGGHVSTYDGTKWSVASRIAGATRLGSVSCAAESFCLAGASDGYYRFDGTSWTRIPYAGLVPQGNVACASATFCAVIDQGDPQQFARYNGSAWDTPHVVDGYYGSLLGVSCASSTFCAAVGIVGAAARWNGTAWTSDGDVDLDHALTSVSCVSGTFCVAVDDAGQAVSFDGSRWSAPVRMDGRRWLSAVSCASAGFCVAVDRSGYAVTYDGQSWQPPQHIDGPGLASVSCPTASFCAAGDNAGGALQFDGRAWTANSSNPGIPAVLDCASATFCLMRDVMGMKRFDGNHWTALPANDFQTLDLLSCPTTGQCVGVQGSNSVGYDGRTWSAPAEVGQAAVQISCASTTFCMVVDHDGLASHS